jgi:cerevisin
MKNSEPVTEKDASWGLARISHRKTLSPATFDKYLYYENGGEGVDVYVIDTGISTEHVDFEGRAKWGVTTREGDDDSDGHGHGTHCSGTVVGKKYGVAKKAHVYAVKAVGSDGHGLVSDILKGVEWVADAHTEQVKGVKAGKRKGFKGSTANVSLLTGKSPALELAVDSAVDSGVHFVIAAGNDNQDACISSPGASTKALTVGASGLDDSRAHFSNVGPCVDIFGPGVNIPSAWIGSKTATRIGSGTSMASPHLCGLTAYYLSLQPSEDSEYQIAAITPAKLKRNIISVATEGTLSDIPSDTQNLLAWNGGGISNFSQIVERGAYKVGTKTSEVHS